jgi:hypothetical protein
MYPLSAVLSDMARQCSKLEEKYLQNQADFTRRYFDLEEKYSQGQTDLARVSASLDDARSLNYSLTSQLDSERTAHEVNFLGRLRRTYCLLDAESCFLLVGGETSTCDIS